MSMLGESVEIATRPGACALHGEFLSRNIFGKIWSGCPGCAKDSQEKAREAEAAAAQELARKTWERRIGEAGIPERFRSRTLESFIVTTENQGKALEFATAYAAGFAEAMASGKSALFLGKPGTGKTHLAIGIGLEIMRQKETRSVYFTTVIRAIRRIKDTWSRGAAESESEAISDLTFPSLLILDEVGIQYGSDTEKMILFDVLNDRYENRKPTLLLSNLALDDVKAYLGERVFDRLREDGGEVVTFDWGSHRGRAAA